MVATFPWFPFLEIFTTDTYDLCVNVEADGAYLKS